jgi:nicotinate-nucleotide--dimethylbenzimidazole phosphoribosyltransferase
VGAEVQVVDMGIIPDMDPGSLPGGHRLKISKMGHGTANFTRGPAMAREVAEKAILAGFKHAADLFAQGIDIMGTGDMGIGNTTPSAAIGTVVTGAHPDLMVGRGTGVDDEGLERKRSAIQKGLAIHQPRRDDGLDILSKVGGFEIAGIAGIVLAGAYCRRPVVIDGFISTAGALIADILCPTVRDYLFAGHRSEEPGHTLMLQHLGLAPVLDLGMRLGEGTGGALAMGVMEGALKVFKEVATFEEAGVVGK